MKFQPKTEKEIAEANLWPEGEYGFEVTEANDTASKKGNDMIKLKLRVYNAEGAFKFIDDYLLESMAFKLRHCASTCGLLDVYEGGSLLASDFVGKNGFVKLKITKDETGKYADKNDVKDYVVKGVSDENDGNSPPPGHLAAMSGDEWGAP